MISPAKSTVRGERARVPHRRRPRVTNDALHVTMHLIDGLPSMRSPRAHRRIAGAIGKCQERFGCRVVEYSVLSNHLHLIVEAENEAKLAQAMKGLKVRIAKALNGLWGRAGSIFRERFFARVLTGLQEVRRAVRYVLLNARRHGVSIPEDTPDPCSSGPWYPHWLGRWKPCGEGSPVVRGRTLYLDGIHPLRLDLNEVPGSWRAELAACELDLAT